MCIDTFWFENYLSGRTQSVKINNITSESKNVKFGVPQGSILGPLLFIIYINDIIKVLTNCIVVLYADDIQLLHTGKFKHIDDIINLTEENLSKLNLKYMELGLKINPSKTQCMFVGPKIIIDRISSTRVLKFDGHNIAFSDTVKTLGVTLDKYLTFDSHINSLCRKTKSTLMYIQRMQHKLDKATRKMIVESLVISQLNYCSLVWGKCNKSLLKEVQKVQNFAAKVACGYGKKRDHATPFRNNLSWLNMSENLKVSECLFVYKVINRLIPQWVINFPSNNDRRSELQLRNNNDLVILNRVTNMGQKSIKYSGPKEWNGLPEGIRKKLSAKSFISGIKSFIFSAR
jgi:hypothetical protein